MQIIGLAVVAEPFLAYKILFRIACEMRKSYLAAVLCSVALTVTYWIGQFYPGFILVFSNLVFPFVSGGAAVSCFFALRKYSKPVARILYDELSFAWSCFFMGMFLWFLGELIWTIYVLILVVEVPYPSLADISYLVGYVPLFLALLLYLRTFRAAVTRRALASAGLVVLAVVLASLYLLLTPIFYSGGNSLTLALDIAYPVMDLALFTLSFLGFLMFFEGKLGEAWLLISLGLILTAVADLLFSYTTLQGIYFEGHPSELPYLWGYLALLLGFDVHRRHF